MTRIPHAAGHRAASSSAQHRRLRRPTALAAALAVIAFALVAISTRSDDPPSFGRGGAFTVVPRDDAAGAQRAAVLPEPSAAAAADAARAASPRAETLVTQPEGRSGQAAPAESAERLVDPASGTYTYDLRGTESVTGFGSRRFPSTLTLVANPGEKTGTHIFDITYSEQHEERQIVRIDDEGLAFVFEAGSVSFFITQDSETDYAPPIAQVPFPLRAGVTRYGTSTAKNTDGTLSRVIDWRATVTGRETIAIGGENIDTWVVKVTRQSRPGTNDQEKRTRTYWYDAGRGIWVKWTEDMTASRRTAFGNFDYHNESTVTLRTFSGTSG